MPSLQRFATFGVTVTSFKGFGDLQSPHDLVQKLAYDLDRIRSSPEDQYAAFDFFVTAEHIVDWMCPSDKKAREAIRSNNPILRITSHIANGVKHFKATAPQHKSVGDIEKSKYVESGYGEDEYFEAPLVVHLTTEEQNAFGIESVEVLVLAQQVYDYWKLNVP